jgi:large subunit ribosomal protein L19
MDINTAAPAKPNSNVPTNLRPGDTVKVNVKIREAGRERIQQFQGVIIKIQGGGKTTSFTVRRIAHGIGVERTFFTHSPILDKVEVVRRGDVSRAKLYYLRKRSGKAARIKETTSVPTSTAEQEAEPEQGQSQ